MLPFLQLAWLCWQVCGSGTFLISVSWGLVALTLTSTFDLQVCKFLEFDISYTVEIFHQVWRLLANRLSPFSYGAFCAWDLWDLWLWPWPFHLRMTLCAMWNLHTKFVLRGILILQSGPTGLIDGRVDAARRNFTYFTVMRRYLWRHHASFRTLPHTWEGGGAKAYCQCHFCTWQRHSCCRWEHRYFQKIAMW